MSALAVRTGALNLGQGFPDFGWPEPILQRASRALVEESNQYPPSRGLPQLREAIRLIGAAGGAIRSSPTTTSSHGSATTPQNSQTSGQKASGRSTDQR